MAVVPQPPTSHLRIFLEAELAALLEFTSGQQRADFEWHYAREIDDLDRSLNYLAEEEATIVISSARSFAIARREGRAHAWRGTGTIEKTSRRKLDKLSKDCRALASAIRSAAAGDDTARFLSQVLTKEKVSDLPDTLSSFAEQIKASADRKTQDKAYVDLRSGSLETMVRASRRANQKAPWEQIAKLINLIDASMAASLQGVKAHFKIPLSSDDILPEITAQGLASEYAKLSASDSPQ
jgi:hypothetical protein